jgi:hypothetical protein
MTLYTFSSSAHSLVRRDLEYPRMAFYTVVVGAEADEEADETTHDALSKLEPISLRSNDPRVPVLPPPYGSVPVGLIDFLVSTPFSTCGVEDYPETFDDIWEQFDAYSGAAEAAVSDARHRLTPEFLQEMMEVGDDEWLSRFAVAVNARVHPYFERSDVYLAAVRELLPLTRASAGLLVSLFVPQDVSSNHARILRMADREKYVRDLPGEAIRMRPEPYETLEPYFRVYAAVADAEEDHHSDLEDLQLRCHLPDHHD